MYGVHLKLHPGICYSHAGSCASPPPRFIPCQRHEHCPDCQDNAASISIHTVDTSSVTTHADSTILGFHFRSATADWAYPFDLCGCVYRTQDVHTITALIKSQDGKKGFQNPNVLEVSGNKVLWGGFAHYTLGGCVTRPVCSVVTVNMVQNTYEVPIYSASGGDLVTLNSYVRGKESTVMDSINDQKGDFAMTLDYARYKSSNYISVHIKDLFLHPTSPATVTVPPVPIIASTTPLLNDIKVSVVLPICNGARFISRCLQSIFRQTHPNLEVICILNGCTDTSEALCTSYVSKFAARDVVLTLLMLEDASLVGALQAGLKEVEARAAEPLKSSLFPNDSPSPSTPLQDHDGGVRGYVCRMDVDDVMIAPDHVTRQVQFPEAHPSIHVVGTQSFISRDPSLPAKAPEAFGKEHESENMCFTSVAAGIPTHPVLVQWEMLFRCVVLHPSVMFRTEVIASCGAYTSHLPLTSNCAEDYVLWAQVMQKYPYSIANLAGVDMCLSQHASSKSVLEKDLAQVESRRIQWSLVEPLLNQEGGGSTLSSFTSAEKLNNAEGKINAFSIFVKLFQPEDIVTASEIKLVCRLIQILYTNFLLSLPSSECSDEALLCLLKESKIKIASRFLSKCAFKFTEDNFTEELAMLEVNPTLLLKYQLLGL